jgi:hypothetical protein
MQTRFNFSYGGEFLYSNLTPFSGYFNVNENSEVYTGRYYDSGSSKLLNLISEYSSDYYKTAYYKDRNVFDDVVLPYKLTDILIEPNEIVNYNVLNTKIQYLHNNLMYMYSQLFVGSTDVPIDDNVNTICNPIGTSIFQWTTRPARKVFGFGPLSAVPTLSAYKEFDNMKRFVVIPFDDKMGVSILAITDTHLIGLTSLITDDGQLSAGNFTLYTNVIDNYSQETCKNLEDITYDGRYIYISDSKINGGGQVFRYDINSYYSRDKAFEYKRFLVETIGGYGDSNRINKFNGCSVLGSNLNAIWVYDSGNNMIKIYNKNFVWKKTIKIPTTRNYKILDIKNRTLNNHMYVLFEDSYDTSNVQYGLMQYDEQFQLVDTIIFEDVLYIDTDKRFKRMTISEQDSNVFYVITDNTIFKKFFSRPEKTFAIFDRQKFFPDDTFIWDLVDRNWENLWEYELWNYAEFFKLNLQTKDIVAMMSGKNKDDLFFIGNSYISHLNERTDYFSLLQNDNLPYYNYNSIKFENMEYNQAIVLNKEFFKLFQNIIQFKNNLKGRFFAEFNEFGDIRYTDYIYLTNDEINTLNLELDYNSFVNDNELVQPNVINRVIGKIYDTQYKLLNLTKTKLKNIKTWVDPKNGNNAYPIE